MNLNHPAFWGAAGSFIYAAPQLTACLVAGRHAGHPPWSCILEFAVALATGAIASAAFLNVVLGVSPMKDGNAVSAMIGLLANSTAPVLVKRLSKLAGDRMASKLTGDGE
jgi:hypothetical protein